MKIKTLTAVSVLVPTMLLGSITHAEKHIHTKPILSPWYAKVEAGISTPDKIKVSFFDKGKSGSGKGKLVKNAIPIGLGVGYVFNEWVRTDLILGYRLFKANKKLGAAAVSLSATSLMLNGYLDAHNNTIFTPYLMAGIGASSMHLKNKPSPGESAFKSKDKIALVWNVGAGARARVSDQIDVDLGYRFINLSKYKLKIDNSQNFLKLSDIKAQEVLFGVIFKL